MSESPNRPQPAGEHAGAAPSARAPQVQHAAGQAMNGDPLKAKVVITSPHGFHMRPQAVFARTASKFQSAVFLYDGENQKFDGKSQFSLLGLLAEKGTELTLEVCGPDQDQALEALVHLMANLSELEEDPGVNGNG